MELGTLHQKLGPLLNTGDGRKNKIKLEGNVIVVLDQNGNELARIEA